MSLQLATYLLYVILHAKLIHCFMNMDFEDLKKTYERIAFLIVVKQRYSMDPFSRKSIRAELFFESSLDRIAYGQTVLIFLSLKLHQISQSYGPAILNKISVNLRRAYMDVFLAVFLLPVDYFDCRLRSSWNDLLKNLVWVSFFKKKNQFFKKACGNPLN